MEKEARIIFKFKDRETDTILNFRQGTLGYGTMSNSTDTLYYNVDFTETTVTVLLLYPDHWKADAFYCLVLVRGFGEATTTGVQIDELQSTIEELGRWFGMATVRGRTYAVRPWKRQIIKVSKQN